jgi:hypothetical protein
LSAGVLHNEQCAALFAAAPPNSVVLIPGLRPSVPVYSVTPTDMICLLSIAFKLKSGNSGSLFDGLSLISQPLIKSRISVISWLIP